MSNGLIYAMGIAPGKASEAAIIGVPERSIYRDASPRIAFFDTWGFTGGYTSQVIQLLTLASQFRPLAMVIKPVDPSDPDLISVSIGARLQMCVDTSYTLSPLFYQTHDYIADSTLKAQGLYTPESEQERTATRHAITFIRKAKADPGLRAEAWGSDTDFRNKAHKTTRTRRPPRPARARARRA